uniref:Holocytochrome c-type synthase n=1 Tax=Lygus hesperus TaxID=30085 RepID=A0A0A9XB08_LYGHE
MIDTTQTIGQEVPCPYSNKSAELFSNAKCPVVPTGDDLSTHSIVSPTSLQNIDGIENPHEILGNPVPATKDGNVPGLSWWLNPTPLQLFHALRRKRKEVEEHEAYAVAYIHAVVVENTWNEILKYEKLHEKECEAPTLERFEGKYGDTTIKTHINNF